MNKGGGQENELGNVSTNVENTTDEVAEKFLKDEDEEEDTSISSCD